MEQWVRTNRATIPWALLGADLGIRLGARLYKTYNGCYQDESTIGSPTHTQLLKLTPAEAAGLPYPPDAFPGARDVTSPYGSLRVYEWGPDGGRKVVLVHGITNPCVALGAVAHGLVDRGCRVILFDLPGRGYSSTPVPTPQSTRVFTTCILLAITSSPIPWTGTGGNDFHVIGYSLGGGIAACFASYFPSLISSLVLIAPAGLVRADQITFANKMIYDHGVLGDTWLERVVTKRLKSGALPVKAKSVAVETQAHAEVPEGNEDSIPEPLSRKYPEMPFSNIIPWQVEANRGFVKAYISSIRYGPISNQHEDWRRLGQRLNAQKLNSMGGEDAIKTRLQNGKVLIICGTKDVLINPKELTQDAAEVLGENNFEFRNVDAGHELPVTKSKEIVDIVYEFWQR